MRAFKVIAALVIVLVIAFSVYIEVIYPATWHSNMRRESIKLLKAAQTTDDLMNAVGRRGAFFPLTNNQWVAIRYRDTHAVGIRSMAMARDSGGGWFESRRHFCGTFSGWKFRKRMAETEEELRKSSPELFTNDVAKAESESEFMPSHQEMMAIESASDLEKAREALKKIGFTEFRP